MSLWPVPSEVVTELPRVRVELRDLPDSGLSFWDGQAWVVCLNHRAATGQRFTVLHEFKQLVDHGHAGNLYIGNRRQTTDEQAEQAAYSSPAPDAQAALSTDVGVK